MSKQVSDRSWLYSWGSRAQESVTDSESQDREATGSAHDYPNTEEISQFHGSQESETVVRPSTSSVKSSHTTRSESDVLIPTQTGQKLESSSNVGVKSRDTHSTHEQTLEFTPASSSKSTLKQKPSTTSLRSYATSNWLGWGSKTARSYSLPEEDLRDETAGRTALSNFETEDVQKNDIGSIGERCNTTELGCEEKMNQKTVKSEVSSQDCLQSPEKLKRESSSMTGKRENSPPGKPETSVINLASQNNTPTSTSPRKKSWGFWGSADDSTTKQDTSSHSRFTNTILKSSPALLSRLDLQVPESGSTLTKDSAVASDSRPGSPKKEQSPTWSKADDAVLYESHKSAEEYSKINTQRNENLKQNILVPDWNTCLKVQDGSHSTSTTSELHTSSASRVLNIKAWISYLSHFSSKLGLTSSDNHDEGSSNGDTRDSNNDDLFRTVRERSYRLYGQSLCRLPAHKRACLPNHSMYYTTKKPLTADGPVSVSSDAMGNLSINYKTSTDRKTAPLQVSSRNVGSLQKIKKILIIGVHGFFPTKMVRPLIGAPKGTSSKFANEAEKAMIRYLVENDMICEDESQDVSIQKIALEKEGKIFDRVEFFLQIISKWEHDLNEAEFVFVAAHSQGCVVSIILLARLIKQGILKRVNYKRIGILAMAGVNNGPFYGVDNSFFLKAYSTIEHESMLELFELTKFNSPQSIAYKDAIQTIISFNVKLCLVGSINDQLVPLYSALASHIYHPNIYRACYIDHASKTPAFLESLISLCCQMQNIGFFDNSVIREISPILAGPLTGNGHSKIYNDGKVYDLGIKFMLDTDDLVIPLCGKTESELRINNCDDEMPMMNSVFVKEYNVGKIGTNPYILPWCLRGLVFNVQKNWRTVTERSDTVHKSAREEINDLYERFDQWRPETKLLKDLKFRLNGIRSSKL